MKPLAQREEHKRRTVVISTRLPSPEYDKVRQRAQDRGYGSMGDYLRTLAREDAGIPINGA
jgi:hypothetical protein